MKKLKYVYKIWSSKSKTEKYIIKILNDSKFDIDPEKQMKPLLDSLINHDPNQDSRTVYEILLTNLRQCKTAHEGLKLLYLCHEAMDLIGKPFIDTFLMHEYVNIHHLKKHTFDTDNFVSKINSSNYYNFLLSYGTYYADIQAMSLKDLDSLLESLYTGEYECLSQLVTFKNVIKYSLKILESMQTSMAFMKKGNLLQKISYRVFADSAWIYNLISDYLRKTIGEIFKIPKELVFLLNELYSDIIQITKKLKTFQDSMEGLSSVIINYYEFNPEFNKKEELYVLSLTTSNPPIQKPYLDYLKQYQRIKYLRDDSLNSSIANSFIRSQSASTVKVKNGYEKLLSPDHKGYDMSPELQRNKRNSEIFEGSQAEISAFKVQEDNYLTRHNRSQTESENFSPRLSNIKLNKVQPVSTFFVSSTKSTSASGENWPGLGSNKQQTESTGNVSSGSRNNTLNNENYNQESPQKMIFNFNNL